MSCINDGDICHFDSTTIYCCSRNCIQNGETPGYCATTVTTPTAGSSSTGTIPSACLPENAQCLPNGSLGTCCSYNCLRIGEEAYGKCLGASPRNVSEKCLELGADCSVTEPDRFNGSCCTKYCNQIAPHPIGTCDFDPNAPKQTENHFPSWVIYTSITLFIVCVILLGFIWLYRRQRKLEKGLTQNEADQFFNGNPDSTFHSGYAHENVDNIPYNKDLEISESDFNIDTDSQLGSGCYGLVLKGKVKGVDVAAKTIRSNLGDGTNLRSLLSEIKTLQYIGSFENVVSMIGCNTSDLKNGKVFLFLEYCPLGSLEKYLRTNKYSYASLSQRSNQYVNTVKGTDTGLNCSNLLQWSMQITNAMIFLESKKVIHADLATRNVLLLTKDCAKLTDFGLSRKLYEYGNYVKTHQEPLPWRWMALESLQQLSFSHQSDVWSLGITFWEIYSLGDTPYPGLSWTTEFLQSLENDLRPHKPANASDELYDIMLDCWKPVPNTRPNFFEIYKRLHEYQRRYESETNE